MHRIIAIMLLLVALGPACNTSEFKGNTPRRASEKKPLEPIQPQHQEPNPISTPEPALTPNAIATPHATPNPGAEIPPATTPPIDIDEIVNGIIDTIDDVEVEKKDTEVVFGGKKVFHIGDANFSAESNCASEIHAYRLKGTRYFFEFQVLRPDTTVDIGVNKICGVDYEMTSTVHLQNVASDMEQRNLAKETTNVQFSQRVLQPGKYMVVVESNQAGSQNPESPSDFDDFIVGEVRIKANKKIKPGRVGAK